MSEEDDVPRAEKNFGIFLWNPMLSELVHIPFEVHLVPLVLKYFRYVRMCAIITTETISVSITYFDGAQNAPVSYKTNLA